MGTVELAATIVKARHAAEISLRALHRASGVSLSYLHDLEHGRIAEPSPHTLRKLAEPLGVEYMTLMRAAGYL